MTWLPGIIGAVVAGLGLAAAVVALEQRRLAPADPAAWLRAEMRPTGGGAVDPARSPAGPSVLRLLLGGVARWVGARTPGARLDRLHDDLLRAGLAGRLRAEEVYTVHLVAAAGSVVLAAAWVMAADPPRRLAVAGSAAVVTAGVALPRAWLRRRVAARRAAIFTDLPDALDLMVIGMEAGVTFDGALQVVTDHLDSPLGHELARTLAEMELGLSRRDALQNLKRRADVPELTAVVVALLQADALGMSVSRVLRVQAAEMRAKRRQWAREKAGKLPVKILFPLVVFIFPPVMVVVIGPAFSDLRNLF